MTQKKSRFLTFCFSLIPGAAEMYMGFMKMGVSLMAIFAGTIALSSVLNIGVLGIISMILWFYGFFHANNLASMSDEKFQSVQDEYLFNVFPADLKDSTFIKGYRNVLAGILIFIGVVLVWNQFFDFFGDMLPHPIFEMMCNVGYYVPNLVVGIAVIVAGIFMIRGKKEKPETKEEE